VLNNHSEYDTSGTQVRPDMPVGGPPGPRVAIAIIIAIHIQAQHGCPGVKQPFSLIGQSLDDHGGRGEERVASRASDIRRHPGQEHFP
jgi:hypothetical protein